MDAVFPIIFSVCIIGLLICESVMQQKILKRRLLASFLNAFLWVAIFACYDNFIKDKDYEPIVNIYAAITYGAFGLTAIFSFKETIVTHQHYQSFINSINKTKFNAYYAVDSHEKIKDISSSILVELGLKKEDVIGKKIFDVFDKTIRFTKMNDCDVNNKTLREFYLDYRKKAKPNEQDKREIQFQNYKGELVILNMVEQPLFILGKYSGRMNVGEKRSASSLMNVEKELIEKNKELESIRYKFIATLELTEEGLFYVDLDEKYIWGTDAYAKTLSMSSNTISIDDFQGYMYKDDLAKYASTLQSLTPQNPRYQVTYRYKRGNEFIWIKEVGKRIFDDENANVVLGFVKIVNSNAYEKSNIPELDSIRTDIDLIQDINHLFESHRIFELAIIRLKNIPELNERYSRQVGNMMIGEYVRKLRQSFMSENSQVYRIGGLDFALTITDVRKIDMFKKMLEADGNSLNLPMEYGSIKETVKVDVGIAIANEDAVNTEDLYKAAKQALKVANNFQKGYCFYRDIR